MIKTSNNTIADLLKENYDRVLQSVAKSGNGKVMSDYFGSMDEDFIQGYCARLEEEMFASGEAKSTIKKVFAVLIEGLQNISIHGVSVDELLHPGANIIIESADQFTLHFMNLMETSYIPKMKTYLDKLNGMNKEETKELYMETLSNGLLSEKGGAGLGYLTMRLKSLHTIDYTFTDPIDNLCGYHYVVKVDRKK